ncbi:MAG: 16S rRNA (cytosine(967)-C(5))-methyltransferase [Solirubrobacterales bacterium 70-9]|nr:MAG: 16S rRNA (cytosine(967)-C(5))-methyltransferase [Solirubrobacterales bacterium 70-9]
MPVVAPRALAFEVLRETFERGAHTELAFRAGAEKLELVGRDRAQAQRLAYGSVQRRGTADAAIERLSGRAIRLLDPPVAAALRLGLYELLFADGTPDHAAVDQAVELVKIAKAGHASGFVNAILRRAAREREELTGALLGDDSTPEAAATAHSAPLWLARMWWEELGAEAARSLLAACNEPAEVAMRAADGAARADLVARLRGEGVDVSPAAGPWPLDVAEAMVFAGRVGDSVPRLVAEGALTPQSRGSAAVVEVLAPRPGETMLDLCAGPGIKTGQIAARMEDRGEVISVELDPARAAEIAAQSERLNLRGVTIFEGDATSLPMPEGFDRILLDAPCSDLGTLASRPDARWRKSPRTIERVAEVQEKALLSAAKLVRPGGTLVYSTCTISRRENEDRVAALLEASAAGQAQALELDDLGALAPELASTHEPRTLQLRPDRDRTTGFFISRLTRND